MKKTMVAVFGGMLVAVGSYLTYLQAQPQEQMSDLTLANIEAMASGIDFEDNDEFGLSVTIRCKGAGDIPCPTGGTAGEVKSKVHW